MAYEYVIISVFVILCLNVCVTVNSKSITNPETSSFADEHKLRVTSTAISKRKVNEASDDDTNGTLTNVTTHTISPDFKSDTDNRSGDVTNSVILTNQSSTDLRNKSSSQNIHSGSTRGPPLSQSNGNRNNDTKKLSQNNTISNNLNHLNKSLSENQTTFYRNKNQSDSYTNFSIFHNSTNSWNTSNLYPIIKNTTSGPTLFTNTTGSHLNLNHSGSTVTKNSTISRIVLNDTNSQTGETLTTSKTGRKSLHATQQPHVAESVTSGTSVDATVTETSSTLPSTVTPLNETVSNPATVIASTSRNITNSKLAATKTVTPTLSQVIPKATTATTSKPSLTLEQQELLGRHFKSGLNAGRTELDDLIPDDEPFGSAIWKDQRYMISVMIPIGVGITGAMVIMVMAYASKLCKKESDEEQTSSLPRLITQPSATGTKPDDTMLLKDSSDEEF